MQEAAGDMQKRSGGGADNQRDPSEWQVTICCPSPFLLFYFSALLSTLSIVFLSTTSLNTFGAVDDMIEVYF